MEAKKQQKNKFVKWVTNLSAYTKNKTINALMFFLAFFIIGGANYCIMFGKFVPTFFILDFFIILMLIAPIFFFKKTMFDRIYFPIILFFLTIFYTLNACYYAYFGTVFSFKDIAFALQNIEQLGYHSGEVDWRIIVMNVVLFVVFATGIVLYNALWRFQESNRELKIRGYKKAIFASVALVSSMFLYEFSLQMWRLGEKSKGVDDIDYVNYSPNYHFSNLGMIGYYTQETRQLVLDKGASVEQIKHYLTSGSYLHDDATGLLGGSENGLPANVFVMMIETGDQCMLNPATTPNLWRLLNGGPTKDDLAGMNCDHNYSLNHSNVSEIISINGSYPTTTLKQLVKWKFPFNMANVLRENGYKSYYMADIVHDNDCYNSMNFMKKFDFDTYWFHDQMIPEVNPWSYRYDDYTRDSIFINKIVENIKSIDAQEEKQPFYMHYITIHMHMDNDINKHNKELFEDLEATFGATLDKAEADGKWVSPFAKGSKGYQKHRNYTLKTMDFDMGLGMLMDCLYGPDSSDYLKNSILTVYGDHPWFESTGTGHTFAQELKGVYDFENIKQHATILGMYNPILNQYIEDHPELYPDHKYGKITWPTVIVPTVFDLLGVKYNPRMYQGKSLFDPSYNDDSSIFYSLWTARYMNEHYTSNNGISITKVIDDNGTKKQFENRLDEMRLETRIFSSIYQANIFASHDYKDFMPQELINYREWL